MRRRAVSAEQQAVQARAEENRFRREAEARADIAQAAILLNRGKFNEAERLAGPVAGSRSTSRHWRRRGSFAPWEIARRRKDGGRRRRRIFKRSRIAAEVEKTEYTDHTASDVLRLGPTLIAAGDLPGYHQFVKQTIASFSTARDLGAAEQITKTCLIAPADADDLAGLEPLVKVMAQTFEQAKPDSGDKMVAWRGICAFAL